jgi:hypothetical protein
VRHDDGRNQQRGEVRAERQRQPPDGPLAAAHESRRGIRQKPVARTKIVIAPEVCRHAFKTAGPSCGLEP